MAGILGGGGPALRLEGEAVDVVAGKALEGGDEIGADALRHLEDPIAQVEVVAVLSDHGRYLGPILRRDLERKVTEAVVMIRSA